MVIEARRCELKAMRTDVIVIGAGIAGLACAVELSRAGLGVTVVEKGRVSGGRARSWPDPTTSQMVDIGPHILLSEYRNVLHLLDLLGTRDKVVWQKNKILKLVGRPHPVDIYTRPLPAPLHYLPCLLSLPQVSLRDLVSNRRLMWKVMRMTPAELDRLDLVDAESWLRDAGVTERFIDWFWRSTCMTIMNVPLEECSAGALLRFFRFMISRQGCCVGFPAIGLGELFVPPAEDRIESSGGSVLHNEKVTGLQADERSVRGIRLADGSGIEAPALVAAVPPGELHELVPGAWRDGHFFRLPEFRPSPCISTYLWFDRKLTRERFWTRAWSPDNLTYDSYDLSNIRHAAMPQPSLIASNVSYSGRAGNMSDGEIVAQTRRELEEFLPQAASAHLRYSRVHRIPMAIPAAVPGAEALRLPNRTPFDGLFLAGDWTDTGLPWSMESAVYSGFRAAEEVLQSRGRPKQLASPPPGPEGLARLVAGAGQRRAA